jgi:hypothetical protein
VREHAAALNVVNITAAFSALHDTE